MNQTETDRAAERASFQMLVHIAAFKEALHASIAKLHALDDDPPCSTNKVIIAFHDLFISMDGPAVMLANENARLTGRSHPMTQHLDEDGGFAWEGRVLV